MFGLIEALKHQQNIVTGLLETGDQEQVEKYISSFNIIGNKLYIKYKDMVVSLDFDNKLFSKILNTTIRQDKNLGK